MSAENVIYQAKVTTSTTKETYIGLCDATLKLRYRNHIYVHFVMSGINMPQNLVNTYGA